MGQLPQPMVATTATSGEILAILMLIVATGSGL